MRYFSDYYDDDVDEFENETDAIKHTLGPIDCIDIPNDSYDLPDELNTDEDPNQFQYKGNPSKQSPQTLEDILTIVLDSMDFVAAKSSTQSSQTLEDILDLVNANQPNEDEYEI